MRHLCTQSLWNTSQIKAFLNPSECILLATCFGSGWPTGIIAVGKSLAEDLCCGIALRLCHLVLISSTILDTPVHFKFGNPIYAVKVTVELPGLSVLERICRDRDIFRKFFRACGQPSPWPAFAPFAGGLFPFLHMVSRLRQNAQDKVKRQWALGDKLLRGAHKRSLTPKWNFSSGPIYCAIASFKRSKAGFYPTSEIPEIKTPWCYPFCFLRAIRQRSATENLTSFNVSSYICNQD